MPCHIHIWITKFQTKFKASQTTLSIYEVDREQICRKYWQISHRKYLKYQLVLIIKIRYYLINNEYIYIIYSCKQTEEYILK